MPPRQSAWQELSVESLFTREHVGPVRFWVTTLANEFFVGHWYYLHSQGASNAGAVQTGFESWGRPAVLRVRISMFYASLTNLETRVEENSDSDVMSIHSRVASREHQAYRRQFVREIAFRKACRNMPRVSSVTRSVADEMQFVWKLRQTHHCQEVRILMWAC